MSLDTRDVNNFIRPPPSTKLPSAAAFSALETWELQSEDNGLPPLHFSAGDVADYFYHIQVPEGLSDWFSLPAIDAKYMREVSFGDRAPHLRTKLVPLFRVLPISTSLNKSMNFVSRTQV